MLTSTHFQSAEPPRFGAIIIGDEILSGKREDKHLRKIIEILGARGLSLAYAHYVGDNRERITATLRQGFESGDVLFSCGGIGATPDDHTRQCAAAALGEPLALHAQAARLIRERMEDMAREQGVVFDPERADNVHRYNMGVFPESAAIIPNPYNKIPGFSCRHAQGGQIHFVPGFPVMAWPMIEWVLDTYFSAWFHVATSRERSIIVYGGLEASLTPLMEAVEARFPTARVFSLPSVDHPEHGRHIELGVKGQGAMLEAAYQMLKEGLIQFGASIGPELVR